jgi:hypothetical protein
VLMLEGNLVGTRFPSHVFVGNSLVLMLGGKIEDTRFPS